MKQLLLQEASRTVLEIQHIEAVLRCGATNAGKINDSFRKGLEQRLQELKQNSKKSNL
jgi:hypothetical protein